MGIGIEDYPDMAADLVRGGFDDAETAAMIRFVGKLYSGQNDVIESFRVEVREQFEFARKDTNARFDQLRKETNERFDQSQRETNARLDRVLYAMIAILAGQLVAIVGAVLALVF